MSVCVVVAVFEVSLCFCCCHTHPLHIAHWLKIFVFASDSIPWSSPCRMHELSVLSDFLDLFINFTFLLFFIFIFQHFLLPFIFPEVKLLITLRTVAEEMGSNDKNFSSTGYEPNDYFLTETYVEFNQEFVTEQRLVRRATVPRRRWITTTPQSVRCSLTHTEDKSITPNEKACRLVCRRRQCPKIERAQIPG